MPWKRKGFSSSDPYNSYREYKPYSDSREGLWKISAILFIIAIVVGIILSSQTAWENHYERQIQENEIRRIEEEKDRRAKDQYESRMRKDEI